jgi:hypothetical protein
MDMNVDNDDGKCARRVKSNEAKQCRATMMVIAQAPGE